MFGYGSLRRWRGTFNPIVRGAGGWAWFWGIFCGCAEGLVERSSAKNADVRIVVGFAGGYFFLSLIVGFVIDSWDHVYSDM